MPVRRANSIGRDGVVMTEGDAEDIAAERVVRRVDAAQRQVLIDALKLPRDADQDRLDVIANTYYRDLAQRTDHPPSKGEQNTSIALMLDWVAQARRDTTDRARMTLDAQFTQADDDLGFRLMQALSRRHSKSEGPSPPVEALSLDDIETILLDCRSTSRGPLPPSPAQVLLIAGLIDLYETVTGQTATHNPKIMTQYTGSPESDAGRFVDASVRIIDPGILPNTVANLMADCLKGRRVAGVGARRALQAA